MLASWGLQDSTAHEALRGLLAERAHLECLVELVSMGLLERRVRMEKLETPGQLESSALLVVKAMWGKRGTLAPPVQPGLPDPEEHQGRMDPKATLALLGSPEIQDLLENLATME